MGVEVEVVHPDARGALLERRVKMVKVVNLRCCVVVVVVVAPGDGGCPAEGTAASQTSGFCSGKER